MKLGQLVGLLTLGIWSSAACGDDGGGEPIDGAAGSAGDSAGGRSGSESGASGAAGSTSDSGSSGTGTQTAGAAGAGASPDGGSSGAASETAGAPAAGGAAGSAGAESAGEAGAGPDSTAEEELGARCASAADCGDLDCILADSGAFETADLGGGSPANGLCTQACETNQDCEALSPGSVCVGFDETTSYCLQGCEFGPETLTGLSEDKCHARFDATCGPLFGDTGEECESDEDCFEDEFCADTCIVIVSACLPQCAADVDCPEGWFCDPGSGFCVEQEPDKKPLGDMCDPEAEEDECNGICLGVYNEDDEIVSGQCHEFCTIGVAPPICGYDGENGPPALCAPALSEDLFGPGAPGDTGLCFQFCNCDSDCIGESICWAFSDGPVLDNAGYCDYPLNADGSERENLPCD